MLFKKSIIPPKAGYKAENPFMQLAIDEARNGIYNGHGGPFGAVIVKDGKIIAKGHNHVLITPDSTCHGEIDAIRKADKKLKTFDLSGCEIYTTGKTCPMCLFACLWANISHIYYGCTIDDNEKIGFRDGAFTRILNTDSQPLQNLFTQIDRDACLKLFEEYNSLNGKRY